MLRQGGVARLRRRRIEPFGAHAVIEHADLALVDAEEFHQLAHGIVRRRDHVLRLARGADLQPVFQTPPLGIAPLRVRDRQRVVQGRHHRAVHAHDAVVGGVEQVQRGSAGTGQGAAHVKIGAGRQQHVAQRGDRERQRQRAARAQLLQAAGRRKAERHHVHAGARQMVEQGAREDADAVEPATGQRRFDRGGGQAYPQWRYSAGHA